MSGPIHYSEFRFLTPGEIFFCKREDFEALVSLDLKPDRISVQVRVVEIYYSEDPSLKIGSTMIAYQRELYSLSSEEHADAIEKKRKKP